MKKTDILSKEVQHIDIKSFDARPIIDAMAHMSFSSRDTAKAAEILNLMVNDKECSIILTLAGSTSAAGCMQVYYEMVKNNMVSDMQKFDRGSSSMSDLRKKYKAASEWDKSDIGKDSYITTVVK